MPKSNKTPPPNKEREVPNLLHKKKKDNKYDFKLEDPNLDIINKIWTPLVDRATSIATTLGITLIVIYINEYSDGNNKLQWVRLGIAISLIIVGVSPTIYLEYNIRKGFRRAIEIVIRPIIYLLKCLILFFPAFYTFIYIVSLGLRDYFTFLTFLGFPNQLLLTTCTIITVIELFVFLYISRYRSRLLFRIDGLHYHMRETANWIASAYDKMDKENNSKEVEVFKCNLEQYLTNCKRILRLNVLSRVIDKHKAINYYGFLKIPVYDKDHNWKLIPIACFANDKEVYEFFNKHIYDFPPLNLLRIDKLYEEYIECSNNGSVDKSKILKLSDKYISASSLAYFSGKPIFCSNTKNDLIFSTTFKETLKTLKKDNLIPMSYVCFPLTFGCRMVGVVQILSPTKNIFKRMSWLNPFKITSQNYLLSTLGIIGGNLIGMGSAATMIEFESKKCEFDSPKLLPAANRIPTKEESDNITAVTDYLNKLYTKGKSLTIS